MKTKWYKIKANETTGIMEAIHQMVSNQVLKHCVYIFLHTSSAQVLNSMFVDKPGQGKGGVLENKNKRATEKFKLRREDLNA